VPFRSSIPDPLADLGAVAAKLRAWRASEPPVEVSDGARAAVAAILRQGVLGTEVLFIKRAAREGDPWSGDIAFPGGKREPGDPSLLATAVRETAEEVGLVLTPASFLGRLEDIAAGRNNYRVAGFVFALDGADDVLVPNAEVAELLWTPLADLARPERTSVVTMVREGMAFDVPSIRLGEHVLWGMTYRMVGTLIRVASA
jgi:8-oxo-dGTP pyrophosphatase MutT (NUDIX family)